MAMAAAEFRASVAVGSGSVAAAASSDSEEESEARPPPESGEHPSLPTVVLRPPSLRSVQERLLKLGTVARAEPVPASASSASASSSSKSSAEEAEEETALQPQDLSVKRRDQGSQTDCDSDGNQKKRSPRVASARKELMASDAAATAVAAAEFERARMLAVFRVLLRAGAAIAASPTSPPAAGIAAKTQLLRKVASPRFIRK